MYLKAFEQQTVPDAEAMPLTYLADRACWPANQSNRSPTEAHKLMICALIQSCLMIITI